MWDTSIFDYPPPFAFRWPAKTESYRKPRPIGNHMKALDPILENYRAGFKGRPSAAAGKASRKS
ncbi:hypothetical protein B4135_0741 [Caldibacillus debilis]|uniref:Uncharacterized protein n=1 Tax=Caldibacillus debilis TaxID=301148 RepID=A0A150M6K5_9BACI|nr:hypothetical protein B4135_0741 [Caldibacillus debilis]